MRRLAGGDDRDHGESGGDAVDESPGWGIPCCHSTQGHRVNLGMTPLASLSRGSHTEFGRDAFTLDVKEAADFPGLTAVHETTHT